MKIDEKWNLLRLMHLYFSFFYFAIETTYYNGAQKRKQVSLVCIKLKQAELCLFPKTSVGVSLGFTSAVFFSRIVENRI